MFSFKNPCLLHLEVPLKRSFKKHHASKFVYRQVRATASLQLQNTAAAARLATDPFLENNRGWWGGGWGWQEQGEGGTRNDNANKLFLSVKRDRLIGI